MGYWKSKVLPKIKKVFDKSGTKKAAAEAVKSFDDSKEEYSNALEEKKPELGPKIVEVYETSSTEIKALVKERNEAGLKKHATAVNKFLEDLVKIEFPGAKPVSEASSKFGAALVSGPVFFVFEKVSTFIVTEEKVEEATETKAEEEASTLQESREIVIEEEKKKEEEEKKPEAKVLETSVITESSSSDPPAAEKAEEQIKAETTEAKEEEKPAEPAVEKAEEPSKP